MEAEVLAAVQAVSVGLVARRSSCDRSRSVFLTDVPPWYRLGRNTKAVAHSEYSLRDTDLKLNLSPDSASLTCRRRVGFFVSPTSPGTKPGERRCDPKYQSLPHTKLSTLLRSVPAL